MVLNILDGRELLTEVFWEIARYLVFAHPDRLRHIFERVFSNDVVFALTKEQTNRRIVLFGLQNAVYGGKIEVELTGIIGLKLARL